MLAFYDTTASSLSFSHVLRVKDASSLFQLMFLWHFLRFLCRLSLCVVLGKLCSYRKRCKARRCPQSNSSCSQDDTCAAESSSECSPLTMAFCPKRRARWMKCVKKSAVKSMDEDCPFQCAFNMAKLHLPPPLPLFRKKKRCCKTTQQLEREESCTSITESDDSEVSSEEPDVLTEDDHQQQEDEAQASSSSSSSKGSTTKRPTLRRSYTTPLIDLARMQLWQSILAQQEQEGRLRRREAKYRDTEGLYPLMWACSGNPPLAVVEALLQAYPSAAHKTDREGSTPLHFACHYGASAAVVVRLLQAYPEAVRVQDRYGRSPLYHAVEKRAGMDILNLLVQADPSMTTVPCLPPKPGLSGKPRPLQDPKEPVAVSRAAATRTPLFVAWSTLVADRRARETKRGRAWDKARLLLQASLGEQGPTSRERPLLPSVLAMDIYLPDSVLSLVMEMHPEQVRTPDAETGRLPLLQAAALPLTRPHQTSLARSQRAIKMLLQAYPAAAKTRDGSGRSALWLALRSGHTWSSDNKGIVETLLRACPEALYWRDAQEGLTPALAAATASNTATNAAASTGQQEEDDRDPCRLLSAKRSDWLQERSRQGRGGQQEEEVRVEKHGQLDTVLRLVQADPTIVSAWVARGPGIEIGK